jgi:DinB superfamily
MKPNHWKPCLFIALCWLFASHATATAQTPNPNLSGDDRKALLQRFDDATARTLAAIEKLSDAQWAYKAAPEKWSVAETLEHITLAEGLLFGMVEKTLAAPPNPAWAEQTKDKLALVEKMMLDRSTKVQAPGEIAPAGKLTRADVMAKYKARRAATRKFVKETKAGLHARTGDHPFPAIGTLSAYQWLAYTALHNLRHLQQIEEVKAGAGFPKT